MTSREIALRIMDALFRERSRPEAARTGTDAGSAYTLADFQREGVARLHAILRRWGGAILADGVGLGKTYVGLALVESEIRAGGDAVVVVPAATRGGWRVGLRDLGSGGRRWRLLSHTQLARGAEVDPPRRHRLIVVDEAHRFRNPDTLRYRALARLAAPPARLLLITATPVNNGLADLLHLLRLFVPDHGFQSLGVSSLTAAFEAAGSAGTSDARGRSAGSAGSRAGGVPGARAPHADAALRAIIDAVVVRRTREMVRARFGERGVGAVGVTESAGPRFPRRAEPRPVRYEHPGLARRAAAITALELAPYDLARFGAPVGGGSVPALLRLGLLKRLDSSAAALDASLRRLDAVLRDTLDAARRGRLPIVRWGRGGGDADPLQLALTTLVTRPAPPAVQLEALIAAIRRDLGRVHGLKHGRDPGSGGRAHGSRAPDPKLEALIALLEAVHPDKVLVFTEYRDTAEALRRGLTPRFRVARVDGGGAWLGARPAGRRSVVERFAPRANGRPPPPGRERVDVLVATDVLSEGLNLQDARHVISYDLPWNPVRLLQRIGRLDRLGSPHPEIVPYLFLPADGLDTVLGLTRRLESKLGDIARTVGTGEAGALGSLLGSATTDRPIVTGPDMEGPRERLRTLWIRHRGDRAGGTHGDGAEPAVGTVRARPSPGCPTPTDLPEWVLLAGRGPHPEAPSDYALVEVDSGGAIRGAGTGSVRVLQAALDGTDASGPPRRRPRPPPPPPPRAALESFLRSRTASASAPAPLPRNDPGRRLALEVRRRLLRAGARLDRGTIGRADALCTRLAAPLDPAARRSVRRLLDHRGSLGLPRLMELADRILDDAPAAPEANARTPATWTLIAALHVDRTDGPGTPPGGG